MEIGIIHQPIAGSVPVADVAAMAEERGLARVHLNGDHTHIPARRDTPYPGGRPLPDGHRRALDPMVALAAAAVRTTRIRLGTAVYLLAQRDLISTAKQVASLDVLAPGRIDLGIGYGWNVEEVADHGIAFATRRERVAEYVAAMRRLWLDEEATFEGEFVSFERAWMWPKPAPDALPQILLGASPGPRTFAAIAEWADGWLPVPSWGHGPADVARLRTAVAETGRDPASLTIVVPGERPDPERLDPWAEAGIDAVLLGVPSGSMDEVLPALDAAAAVAERYRVADDVSAPDAAGGAAAVAVGGTVAVAVGGDAVAVAEITALLVRYAECVDRADFDGVGDLFAHATLRSNAGPEAVSGPTAVRDLYAATNRLHDDGTPRTHHLVTNVIVEVESADRARARSYFVAFQATPALALQPIVAGRYHDAFARVDGRWRFAERFTFVDLVGDLSQYMAHDLAVG